MIQHFNILDIRIGENEALDESYGMCYECSGFVLQLSRFTVTAEKFLMVFNVYTNIWL